MPEAGLESDSGDQTNPKCTKADTQENAESAPYELISERSTEDATQPLGSSSEGVPPVSRVNSVSISELPPELQAIVEKLATLRPKIKEQFQLFLLANGDGLVIRRFEKAPQAPENGLTEGEP